MKFTAKDVGLDPKRSMLGQKVHLKDLGYVDWFMLAICCLGVFRIVLAVLP